VRSATKDRGVNVGLGYEELNRGVCRQPYAHSARACVNVDILILLQQTSNRRYWWVKPGCFVHKRIGIITPHDRALARTFSSAATISHMRARMKRIQGSIRKMRGAKAAGKQKPIDCLHNHVVLFFWGHAVAQRNIAQAAACWGA
jgi:hypothetical protein